MLVNIIQNQNYLAIRFNTAVISSDTIFFTETTYKSRKKMKQ